MRALECSGPAPSAHRVAILASGLYDIGGLATTHLSHEATTTSTPIVDPTWSRRIPGMCQW